MSTGPLAAVEKPFVERIASPRVWTFLGFRLPRATLAFLLAAIPMVLIAVAVWMGPAELGKAMTSQKNVQELFARFISATATASAIAVSIATLTFRREMRGVGALEKREEDNHAFRARVAAQSGRRRMPLALGAFLAAHLDAIAQHARDAREAADDGALDATQDGVRLGDALDTLERRAMLVSRRLRRDAAKPDKVTRHCLDFETDVATHLIEGFAVSSAARAQGALEHLADALCAFAVAARYAKTMDTQWGLSNMSWAVLVSTIPSILTAAGMVLAYGDGAVGALGRAGAGALVGVALGIVVLPLAFFVSYVLRFVFLNEHTLPTDGFVLGPEAVDAVSGRSLPRSARRA